MCTHTHLYEAVSLRLYTLLWEYPFSIAVVTNYHTFRSLKQYKFILHSEGLTFEMLSVELKSKTTPSGSFRVECVPWLFQLLEAPHTLWLMAISLGPVLPVYLLSLWSSCFSLIRALNYLHWENRGNFPHPYFNHSFEFPFSALR